MIAQRYELPIQHFDYFEHDIDSFTQEIAVAIRYLAIEQAKSLLYPQKEKMAQHRTKLRKLERSSSVIDRLAYWYHNQMKLQTLAQGRAE